MDVRSRIFTKSLLVKDMLNKIKRAIFGDYKLAVKAGMHVGNGVSVMGGCFFGSEPYLITLHDNVRLSHNVCFVTHDGGTWAFRDMDKYSDVIKYGAIEIGERTFVGANVTIMPGVKIGERCVIGSGSVVTKDVPDNSVACGVPAKIIMTTEEYAEKCLAEMKPYDKKRYSENKKAYLEEYCDVK